MPDNKPYEEEPDEELPFPKYNLPEVYISTPMLLDTYNALYDHAKSQRAIIKHLRTKTRTQNQDIMLLTTKYEALQESIERKRTIDYGGPKSLDSFEAKLRQNTTIRENPTYLPV
jgi:hypothetical protein